MSTDLNHSLPLPAFDRDLSLADLLKGVDHGKLHAMLRDLLGGQVRLSGIGNEKLLGDDMDGPAERFPIHSELEVIGYLVTGTSDSRTAHAAIGMIELLLQSSMRYLMTSDLHLETVQEDYEALQLKHAELEKSESKYRELAAHLEERVQEQVKTIETAQRKLYQSEKMASVGQLAAGVAHEINNPIGFINSNLGTAQEYVGKLRALADVLKEGTSTGSLVDYWQDQELDFVLEDFGSLLEESIEGTERVARIVKDLKAFSNVDRTEEEVADINECIRSACNVATGNITRNATLEFDPGDLPLIHCRPGYIGQAILNILLNAAESIEKHGKIRVKTGLEGDRIRIDISDTGIGIPEDQLDCVFDPFFTTHDVGEGTGLGLTVSRDIVHSHHGEIKLESKPGVGTTVSLWLPVAR